MVRSSGGFGKFSEEKLQNLNVAESNSRPYGAICGRLYTFKLLFTNKNACKHHVSESLSQYL